MKRGTRGTRTVGWAIGLSLACAVGAAALHTMPRGGGNAKLDIVVAELRSRAAEAALVAGAADTRDATDAYTRVQAAQLARRIGSARDDLERIHDGDDAKKRAAGAQASALLAATVRLQAADGRDKAAVLRRDLEAIRDALLRLSRAGP